MALKINKFFLIFLILMDGCTSSSETEYFCESYHKYPNSDDVSYDQAILKISDNSMCVMDREIFQCATSGKITYLPWENQFNKGTEDQYSLSLARNNKNYKLSFYKIEKPESEGSVTQIERSGKIYFSYKGVELNLPLSINQATEENIKTFTLYAISNVEYWNGRMINMSDSLKSFSDIFDDVKNYGVGGSTFKSYYTRANNGLAYSYEFNIQNKSLILNFNDETLKERQYRCDVWIKQKWWQL